MIFDIIYSDYKKHKYFIGSINFTINIIFQLSVLFCLFVHFFCTCGECENKLPRLSGLWGSMIVSRIILLADAFCLDFCYKKMMLDQTKLNTCNHNICRYIGFSLHPHTGNVFQLGFCYKKMMLNQTKLNTCSRSIHSNKNFVPVLHTVHVFDWGSCYKRRKPNFVHSMPYSHTTCNKNSP